jgi:hypothetical protein
LGVGRHSVLAVANASISGRVIDDASGAPLVGASVTLVGSGAVVQRAATQAGGAYAFPDLPPGTYALTATKHGYADGAYGRWWPTGEASRFELGDEHATAVDIRLWPLASLSGLVVDDLGEPIVGAEVAALRRARVGQQEQFDVAGTETTDDRGQYRLASLVPGEYLVAVPSSRTTIPAEASVTVADGWRVGGSLVQRSNRLLLRTESADGTPLTYPTTFAFGSVSPRTGMVFTLAPGEERGGVNIRMVTAPSRSLTGTLIGPNGPEPWTLLRLIPEDVEGLSTESGFEAAQTVSDAGGRFTFHDVPDGRYVVRVLKVANRLNLSGPFLTEYVLTLVRPALPSTEALPLGPSSRVPVEPTLCAVQYVTVGDATPPITLELKPAPRVSGRLVFEGTREPPSPEQVRWMSVGVESADGRKVGGVWNGAMMPGWADERGTFETYGAFPGRYLLRVGGELLGWSPRAAPYQGQDRLDVPLELGLQDVHGVVVLLADRLAQVDGVVVTEAGAPDPDAVVVVFPADPRRWQDFGRVSRRMLVARASRRGAFLLSAVPGGEYYIAALPVRASRNWDTLPSLGQIAPRAQHWQAIEGQTTSRNLRTLRLQ